MSDAVRPSLDREHPWPGLVPFDESDHAFFHGRDAEAVELLRLVRREPLTVLFGRSGLGKTSLLKAGLFLALRGEDFLPAYVRLDHAGTAPPLREQVLRELRSACDAGGVQAAQAAAQEGLWSFFHRRDAEFWSALNRPVTPVIVFDQFEEIFTLGQEGEAARARAAEFLAELADLVENRPPPGVRQALERDPTAAGLYEFRRATVKLVLSFREDFLAEMEELKTTMPSLMYNRLRLLPMDGTQAYAVVTESGGALVNDDVARRILRLAWKNEPAPPVEPAEFPRIEIDPALLSVVCSELNHKRLQAKPPFAQITPALLDGADREILVGFYERSMAGLDGRVRAFVEDELITDRGVRDSHDWDDALAKPGVTRDALDALIARRLLRVDERQGQRRLELTHDVLTRVVKDSRDGRRTREVEEAAQARERDAREQQRKNRRNGALVLAGVVLMLLLAGVAGWQAMEAREATKSAALSQSLAESQQRRADEAGVRAQAEEASARAANTQAKDALEVAEAEKQRANSLGVDARRQRLKAEQLVADAWTTSLMATADALQRSQYDASLLVNVEALRGTSPSMHALGGLLRRFTSNPFLSTYLGAHIGEATAVAFSPAGTLLASASADKTIKLWNLQSRNLRATLEGHSATVKSIAFSPDGKLLVSAGDDKTLILWNVSLGQLLARFVGHRGKIMSVAFSPDGAVLASAGEDGELFLWNASSGQIMASLKGHSRTVFSLALSPDGKQLASAGFDKTVIVWNLETRSPVFTLTRTGEVFGVAFSPDGRVLASAGNDQAVSLWDVGDGKPLGTLQGHRGAVLGIAFNRGGNQLAAANDDKTITVWDLPSRKLLATLEAHRNKVLSVAFSPDGNGLASAGLDNAVILWDLTQRKALVKLNGHTDRTYNVAFSPDGKRLASASRDRSVMLWDTASGERVATLEGHSAGVYDVAVSSDGKHIASAGSDRTVILWDLGSLRILAKLEGHKGPVASVAFSPDGKRLASASSDGTVILWDPTSGKSLATFEGRTGDYFKTIAFSPDGRRLAISTADEKVTLWDLTSGKRLSTFGGYKVDGIAFSPDNKRIASISGRNPVVLWNLFTGQPAKLESLYGLITGVAFSPDGKGLAIARDDKTVILWDLEGRELVATLEGHTDWVHGVAFSPDGKRLASASDDKTVIMWDLDLKSLKSEACRTANRNLTCQEWRQHIDPHAPYRKTCEALPGPQSCN